MKSGDEGTRADEHTGADEDDSPGSEGGPTTPLRQGPIGADLGSVRVDRWLTAARIFKSRTQAQEAAAGSHVRIDGAVVQSSHKVKIGDRIETRAPRGKVIVVATGLAEKRLSPALARQLFEDHSPPPEPREAMQGLRPRGFGRPTKSDRRKIVRFRGGL